MAIGWVGMLNMVPWGDVIKAAPEVAGTARKLWDAVARKKPESDAANAAGGAVHTAASMATRLEHAEKDLAALHAQMLAASEVIATLAQQNAQLVARIEALRKRSLLQAIATGALSVVAIVIAATSLLARGT